MGANDGTQCSPCDPTTPATSRYHARPGVQISGTSVKYHQWGDAGALSLDRIAKLTPKPKGHDRFSTIEVVHAGGPAVERLLGAPRIDASCPVRVYELPETHCEPAAEFKAIFELEEAMMLQRANRQSLIVWVGRADRPEVDGFAGFLGMLPFRGVQVALVSPSAGAHPDPFRYTTPSGVIEHDATDPARMGKCAIAAIFGPLPSRTFTSHLGRWDPISVEPSAGEPMTRLPFKIAGLPLPLITYTGDYDGGVEELAARVAAVYPAGQLFPIVSCGETVDRLGYALDVLHALGRHGHPGYYFAHKSGETNKRWAEYGRPELLGAVARAKAAGMTVLFLAVGGGCNGNATGVVAAMTNSHFIEVPTTPLHYNDATTSAKKAFSLVIDGKIRSKNLLGTFYLPRLVFCINETLLTCSSASIHSTVGECTKTINMLAMPDSAAGQMDYADILGAHEFASDTTRILGCIDGFERLVAFILDDGVRQAKQAVLELGGRIAALRSPAAGGGGGGSGGSSSKSAAALIAERHQLLRSFRELFYRLPEQDRKAVDEFLTLSNLEIVGAKAMFLAYEDPFEKYRALLFEYAHTLGHAVEAWLAGVLERARAAGLPEERIEAATRNHGQCVGMAVVWAGAISAELGTLTGDGLVCHQAMVYLFNSFGGFSFAPVRALCDTLGIGRGEFLSECLAVVRLDNKRGYCECASGESVDQLVMSRPGRMLKSADPNAEVRYMVTIEEERQRLALERAFELQFDLVAHLEDGRVVFRPLASAPRPLGTGRPIASTVRRCIREACEVDAAAVVRLAASHALPPQAAVQPLMPAAGTAPPLSPPLTPPSAVASPAGDRALSSAGSEISWPGLWTSSAASEVSSSEEEDELLSRCTTYNDLASAKPPLGFDIHGSKLASQRPTAVLLATDKPPQMPSAAAPDASPYDDPPPAPGSSEPGSGLGDLRAAIEQMSDFSSSIAAEYRWGYQQWRAGKPYGAKCDGRERRTSGSEEQDAVRSWEEFLANVAQTRRAVLFPCAA